MSNLAHALYDLRRLDDLARQETWVHRLHPLAKLSVVVAYLLILSSFERHQMAPLMPLVLFPIALAAAGGIPAGPIIRRLLWFEPVIVLVGLLNPFFETRAVPFGPWQLGAGWLTFASIVLRGTLAACAALVLTATTGLDGIAAALTKLGLPLLLARQMALTYRYLSLLMEESARALTAYRLRTQHKGISPRDWGSMAGRILLRSWDRADRIHRAMLLRGFAPGRYRKQAGGFGFWDLIFASGWGLYFLAARFLDVSGLLGSFFWGGAL